MRRNGAAMIRTGRDVFPWCLIVVSMLLISAPVSTAQSAFSKIPPVSMRDRLFLPKIGTPTPRGNVSPLVGAIDGTRKSAMSDISRATSPDRGLTIPYWSDSFSYQGFTYQYSMVGTDPK